jgi:hypothetical protein
MGTGDGDDPGPRSPANRGWRRGWTPAAPDPRQIGDGGGDGPPIPGKSGIGDGDDPRLQACAEQLHLVGSRMSPRLAPVAVITRGRRVRIVASVYCQRSALQVRSRHRRRRRRRQCHCLRRSWHDRTWRGSQKIASQTRRTPIRVDVYSIPAMKVRIRNLHEGR